MCLLIPYTPRSDGVAKMATSVLDLGVIAHVEAGRKLLIWERKDATRGSQIVYNTCDEVWIR